MADHTPPPRHQQFPSCGCRDGLKPSHSGVRRILSESVFLGIRPTEDVVTNSIDEADGGSHGQPQGLRVAQQELGLQAVGEGHPGYVPKCQHEAKPVMCDIHGGEDGLLMPEGITHIE